MVLLRLNEGSPFVVFRQGRKCSKDELGASAILTVALDDSMGGAATQVSYCFAGTVQQLNRPKALTG